MPHMVRLLFIQNVAAGKLAVQVMATLTRGGCRRDPAAPQRGDKVPLLGFISAKRSAKQDSRASQKIR